MSTFAVYMCLVVQSFLYRHTVVASILVVGQKHRGDMKTWVGVSDYSEDKQISNK